MVTTNGRWPPESQSALSVQCQYVFHLTALQSMHGPSARSKASILGTGTRLGMLATAKVQSV